MLWRSLWSQGKILAFNMTSQRGTDSRRGIAKNTWRFSATSNICLWCLYWRHEGDSENLTFRRNVLYDLTFVVTSSSSWHRLVSRSGNVTFRRDVTETDVLGDVTRDMTFVGRDIGSRLASLLVPRSLTSQRLLVNKAMLCDLVGKTLWHRW